MCREGGGLASTGRQSLPAEPKAPVENLAAFQPQLATPPPRPSLSLSNTHMDIYTREQSRERRASTTGSLQEDKHKLPHTEYFAFFFQPGPKNAGGEKKSIKINPS